MKVGFAGLGAMGSGMARNILAGGHEVIVYNRTRSKAEPLAEDGATIAETICDLAACEAVFTMLSDDRASHALVFDGGLMEAIPEGAVHIESSTISVAHAAELKQAHAERGHGFVAAPVSGRADLAAAGQLFVLAAGASDYLDRCQPLFDAIGQQTHRISDDPVAGFATKLAVNAMLAGTIALIAENYTMLERWGVPKPVMHDIVTNGILGSTAVKVYGELIAHDRYQPANFPVPLGLKDVTLAIAAGEQSRTAMPIASHVRNALIAALAQGYEADDWSVIARTFRNLHEGPPDS